MSRMTEEEAAFEEFLDNEQARIEKEVRTEMDFHEEWVREVMANAQNASRDYANCFIAFVCLRDIADKQSAARCVKLIAQKLEQGL